MIYRVEGLAREEVGFEVLYALLGERYRGRDKQRDERVGRLRYHLLTYI